MCEMDNLISVLAQCLEVVRGVLVDFLAKNGRDSVKGVIKVNGEKVTNG